MCGHSPDGRCCASPVRAPHHRRRRASGLKDTCRTAATRRPAPASREAPRVIPVSGNAQASDGEALRHLALAGLGWHDWPPFRYGRTLLPGGWCRCWRPSIRATRRPFTPCTWAREGICRCGCGHCWIFWRSGFPMSSAPYTERSVPYLRRIRYAGLPCGPRRPYPLPEKFP